MKKATGAPEFVAAVLKWIELLRMWRPGPPPLLRDDRLGLELLGRMACEFDQISAKDGPDVAGYRLCEVAPR